MLTGFLACKTFVCKWEFCWSMRLTYVASEFLSNSRMKRFPVQNVYITFLEHACGLPGTEPSAGRSEHFFATLPCGLLIVAGSQQQPFEAVPLAWRCIKAAQVSWGGSRQRLPLVHPKLAPATAPMCSVSKKDHSRGHLVPAPQIVFCDRGAGKSFGLRRWPMFFHFKLETSHFHSVPLRIEHIKGAFHSTSVLDSFFKSLLCLLWLVTHRTRWAILSSCTHFLTGPEVTF